MKKTPPKQRRELDDVRAEYRFDYSHAKPNRFASRMKRPVVAVVLESDVAAVFGESAASVAEPVVEPVVEPVTELIAEPIVEAVEPTL